MEFREAQELYKKFCGKRQQLEWIESLQHPSKDSFYDNFDLFEHIAYSKRSQINFTTNEILNYAEICRKDLEEYKKRGK